MAAFSDATIADLPLDAAGPCPWWPEERREVSLARIIVHVISDTTRHAGHADILRESIDGAAGLRVASTNLPDVDWPAYVARLTAVADQFPEDVVSPRPSPPAYDTGAAGEEARMSGSTTWRLPETARGWVTDGGLETDLIFHRGLDLPDFASFPLLDDPDGRAALDDYYRGYADVAARAGAGLLLETPTWRANTDWGARLGYDADALHRVNRDAVALPARPRRRGRPTVSSGCWSWARSVRAATATSRATSTPTATPTTTGRSSPPSPRRAPTSRRRTR